MLEGATSIIADHTGW